MHEETANAPKLTLRQEVDRLQELCAHQAERIDALEKSSDLKSKRIIELEHQVFGTTKGGEIRSTPTGIEAYGHEMYRGL
ncbi:MAG: hypothetical protein M3P51_02425 [Chloroflexota bacterium]|nr:hypothetical protein [Chloroflexota bacterium]